MLNTNGEAVSFKNRSHEVFYREWMPQCRYQDVYHKALVYCLGLDEGTRDNVENIYDFENGCVKTECLHSGWITSGSAKVVRMAFNLYCNGTPTIDGKGEEKEQLSECKMYTVEDIFCTGYARYFWEAIKLRYPEYCFYIDMDDRYEEMAQNEHTNTEGRKRGAKRR